MRRYLSESVHTGVLVRRVGPAGADVDLDGDSAVDEGLLVLLQEFNQLLLGADVAPYPPVHVIEEADDGGLFGEGGHQQRIIPDLINGKLRNGSAIILKKPLSISTQEIEHILRLNVYTPRSFGVDCGLSAHTGLAHDLYRSKSKLP